MVRLHLILRYKVNRGIVLIEVVWHGLNLILDCCLICALLSYNKYFTCMLVPCSQLWVLTGTNSLKCCINRDCILTSILNTCNTTNCIRVTLGYTLAPECVILTIWQNCITIDTSQREHSRIPTTRDDSYLTSGTCRSIYISEMLWNTCVSIEGINYVKQLCILWCLLWKVCCRTTTENHHVNLICPISYLIHTYNWDA